MWPLLICSLLVIYVAIDRFLYYKDNDAGQKFCNEYCALLSANKTEQALELAKNTNGQCCKILINATEMVAERAQKQAYLESQAGIFIANLRSKLDYLSIIVTMSPLLGLLGTIVGMIGAFSIFNLEAGAPIAITGGIGEALIATAAGLCVAILSLCIHSYFSHRLDNIITDMEQCFSALLEADTRSVK